ncbi:mast cell protease 1A-like [Channa argus]|uniref:mast cell protease 1A-like n=1 Tax=Channa argus TaxID=215402 RepID=UPI003521828B
MTMIHMFCVLFVLQLVPITGATESGIVGGEVSKPHSRPYMASLQVQRQHLCGGILIREDFVLTVAHCHQQQPMTVVLGAHDVTKEEKSQQRIKVAKYYKHPDFRGKYDYDIMLIKLKKNATLNRYVRLIDQLPKKDEKIPANIKCLVAGWGKTGVDQPTSNVLRETTEKIQFSVECNKKWGEYFNPARMICTKFTKKTGGICQGDSGGPLICNNKPQGLTAFTLETDCNDPKYPHVFTKVNFFLSWIKKILQV